MIPTKNTFKKEERLCSKVLFDTVFSNGNSFSVKKVRVVWAYADLNTNYPCQVAFSVPKKKFKTAPNRNRIKRLFREAYRKNKHSFYEALKDKEKSIAMVVIFTHTEIPTYTEIEDKIILSLQRLQNEL